jgi:hypothetical protein
MTRTLLTTVLVIFSLASILSADQRDRESLRDLEGVRVAAEDLSLATPVKGFSADQLRKTVEARLRKAGIPVLNEGEFPVGDPYLRVRVVTTPKGGGFVGYDVRVDFVQIVFLRRNPSVTFNRAETWKAAGRMGIVTASRLAERIRQALAQQVDQFIAAYRSVNP